jgi:2-phosphoglycerate kinase
MEKIQNLIPSESLSKKKEILEHAKISLKKEFVGLDNIIDEVIHSIEPWFIYPQGQMRPTIINLLGMTGVGKTSLVNRLCEMIGMDNKLYRFDIGDYSSGDLKLKYDFSHKLKNLEKQPIVLMFDEFQLGRTIGETGSEIDRNGLRALWDLLDTGLISIINDSYYIGEVISLYMKLEHCIKHNVECANGKTSKNKKYHQELLYPDETSKQPKESEEDKVDISLFVPKSHYYYIKHIMENKDIDYNLWNTLKKLDHNGTMKFLMEVIDFYLKPVIHDFSQSLIFVIGNIDEVYGMTDVIDPDYDADIFHSNSLEITTTRAKEALQQRFRAEQIARLGNNYVLYPAFSSESYRQLISMELNKFKAKAVDRYGLNIEFDSSVNDIIYKEGVFPTQGTRPVFTTINTLVESYVSKIMSDIILNDIKIDKIIWKFIDSNSEYSIDLYTNESDEPQNKTYPLKLKLDNLRKSTKDDEQAHIGLHEAGHAVLSCCHLNIIPEEIVSKTTSSSSGGYCRLKYPEIKTREIIQKDIVVGFGGYVAEKMIFGDDMLSIGSQEDIKQITNKAITYVKKYGMGGIPMLIGVEDVEMSFSHYFTNEVYDEQVKKLILFSLKTAESILSKNTKLLLMLADYMSDNSRMKKEMILEYVNKYGVDVPMIKNDKNYNPFRKLLKDAVKNHEVTKTKTKTKKTIYD